MSALVESTPFLGARGRQIFQRWIELAEPDSIPWTPLPKALSDCRVAVVSSGAVALKADTPFDTAIERANPFYADPSYRVIPRSARAEDIRVYHLHIDPWYGETDLNCLLPVERCDELAATGLLGELAPSHYSYNGFTLEPEALLDRTVPAIIDRMHREGVDVVLLVPA